MAGSALPLLFLIAIGKISSPAPAIRYLVIALPVIVMFSIPIIYGIVGSTRMRVAIPMYKKEILKSWFLSNEFKVAVFVAIISAIITAVATALILGDKP